jgi:hypothetical protein
MRQLILSASLLIVSTIFSGCVCVPRYVAPPANVKASTVRPLAPNAFPVFTNVPRHEYHFTLRQKLNPVWWMENADDPEPPGWYRPGKSMRKFTWAWRNPCHNFTWYVIGIGDKTFTRVGRYPGTISNPNGGWNWAVIRYGYWRFTAVTYDRHRFHFYCGWRRGGNFGMKFNFTPLKKYG